MQAKDVRGFIIRHKIFFRNWSLILAVMALAGYVVFAIDLFENEAGIGQRQTRIELDEALLLGAMLGVFLLAFGAHYYLSQRREMVRRIAAERHARMLAYQDGLTGLPNRRQFDDALKAAVLAPPRASAAHGMFLLDLNGFKQINDVHGHHVGDDLLVVVAQRLQAAMRDGDIVARFGGDEFAILASHLADPEVATSIAMRVIEALDGPINAGGAVHRVGVGIGIALLPIDATSAEEALRKADVALYRAKAERRSAMRFFEEGMDVRVQERASMEAALRDAIERDCIDASYLPTVDLKTHAIIGFEAAPRWLDPKYGEIPPERFVAIAEETGLIHALAERVLYQACRAARQWPAHINLAIDIYPSQLKDELLPGRILKILADTDFAPERLEIEITESALVADLDNARIILGSLRSAGIRIALDNFGTGYSSLYHLRNFKIDKIKIDRSFIQAMSSETESATIVQALVGLGHGLGVTIAAEGIDGIAAEDSLIMSGCEQGQGAAFSGAISASDARKLFPEPRKKSAC